MVGMDGKTDRREDATAAAASQELRPQSSSRKWKFHRNTVSAASGSANCFPYLGGCVDDIAFLHSMYRRQSPIHGSAMLMMNSGKLLNPARPCLGSWVNYGLGNAPERKPAGAFVVMLDPHRGPYLRRQELVQPATCRPPTKGTVFREQRRRRS